jgi:hypothetical protein
MNHPTRRSSRLNAVPSPEPLGPRKRKKIDAVVPAEPPAKRASRPLKPLSARTSVKDTSPKKDTKVARKNAKGKLTEPVKEVIKVLKSVDVGVGPDEVETPKDSAQAMSTFVEDAFLEDMTCSLCCTSSIPPHSCLGTDFS